MYKKRDQFCIYEFQEDKILIYITSKYFVSYNILSFIKENIKLNNYYNIEKKIYDDLKNIKNSMSSFIDYEKNHITLKYDIINNTIEYII